MCAFMETVRIAVVGLGGIGRQHATNLLLDRVQHAELTAVADVNPANFSLFHGVLSFTSLDALTASKCADAVIIATPHYSHPALGRESLRAGLHVLVEKPLAVHHAAASRLIAAHSDRRLVFAAMFNQRTDPAYGKIRQLVDNELGILQRITWIVTDWYRPEAYYRAGGWRGTWGGEGGGILLNQCSHHLDLFQWMFGMPNRVTGFCGFGRYHGIEVEDDATAHFAFSNGAHATLITSTGEAPGANRLEVVGEMGRLVYEDGQLRLWRNEVSAFEFSRTSKDCFGRPSSSEMTVGVSGTGGQHLEIIQNFVDAILGRAELIAPAEEGLHSVELINAILLSAWTGATVELPLDAGVYERALQEKIDQSRRR